MSASETVSHWIAQVKEGQAALDKLWGRYFHRLVGLARKQLENMPQRAAADSEGIALSAFVSFWRGLQRNQFPKLSDRNDLWHLLAVITVRKACDLINRENAQKRGGGGGETARRVTAEGDVDQALSQEPPPELVVELAEECRRLMDRLANDELRQIAELKWKGYTNEQIAGELRCSLRSVERGMSHIRRTWKKELVA